MKKIIILIIMIIYDQLLLTFSLDKLRSKPLLNTKTHFFPLSKSASTLLLLFDFYLFRRLNIVKKKKLIFKNMSPHSKDGWSKLWFKKSTVEFKDEYY